MGSDLLLFVSFETGLENFVGFVVWGKGQGLVNKDQCFFKPAFLFHCQGYSVGKIASVRFYGKGFFSFSYRC